MLSFLSYSANIVTVEMVKNGRLDSRLGFYATGPAPHTQIACRRNAHSPTPIERIDKRKLRQPTWLESSVKASLNGPTAARSSSVHVYERPALEKPCEA